jgi:hypothetical protein
MKLPQLHAGYERLLGTALVDGEVKNRLLRNPKETALTFGISPVDVEMVADIRATDLRAFATALLPRLYGERAFGVAGRSVVAG